MDCTIIVSDWSSAEFATDIVKQTFNKPPKNEPEKRIVSYVDFIPFYPWAPVGGILAEPEILYPGRINDLNLWEYVLSLSLHRVPVVVPGNLVEIPPPGSVCGVHLCI